MLILLSIIVLLYIIFGIVDHEIKKKDRQVFNSLIRATLKKEKLSVENTVCQYTVSRLYYPTAKEYIRQMEIINKEFENLEIYNKKTIAHYV